jgi:hypothetical protein
MCGLFENKRSRYNSPCHHAPGFRESRASKKGLLTTLSRSGYPATPTIGYALQGPEIGHREPVMHEIRR